MKPQEIHCGVITCSHNKTGIQCDLTEISVEPRKGFKSGKPCDECMCASYLAK